jgi:threonine dehydratase
VISLEDVLAAAGRLKGVAHRTPVLTSRTLDETTGATVFLKAENLQRGGAFKIRGAYNKVSSLSPEQRRAGVVAYSSGNHAQGVALAARLVGTAATIIMPEDTPPGKIDATRGYGAEVVLYDRYQEDREALGAAMAKERGLTLVPPYDDPLVMAGQGTAALELLEDVGELDLLMTPVGGGGLIAGSATAARALHPEIRIVGVEPEDGDDHRQSVAAGHRINLGRIPNTIADGLQSPIPGALTFEVNRHLVDEFVTVTEAEIVAAMRFLFERMKTVAEPSGAVAVAALLAGKVEGHRIGAVISGGNVGAARLGEVLASAPGS